MNRGSLACVCLAVASLAVGTGCEAEVGSPCSPDPSLNERVLQEAGRNDLVQDLAFDNCSQGLCGSVDGSRPFCTKRCTTNLDCPADFECGQLISFGPLACQDYTEETDCVTGPNGTMSEDPILYCTATRSTIQIRDCDFGRDPNLDEGVTCESLKEGGVTP